MQANPSYSRGNISLRLARLLALAFMLFCIFLFVVGVLATPAFSALNPDLFTIYTWNIDEMAPVLNNIGLTNTGWLNLNQLLSIVTGVIFCSVGAVIFIRKRDDWFSLFISLWMVMFGTITSSQMNAAAWWYPPLANIIFQIGGLPWPMLFLLFYLFPDGHFSPRWTRWVGLVIVLDFLAVVVLYGNSTPPPILILVFLIAIAIGVASQVYRYRRVSTIIQRQQTKWVVLALLFLFVALILTTIPMIFPAWNNPGGPLAVLWPISSVLAQLAFLLVPLSIGLAILRFRLWDVDFLIRRTLVYSALTGTLLVVYVFAVLLLQALVGRVSGSLPGIAIVASTLLIAAMFTPLRRRIQRDIDRRFYRRKYDAQQTVAGFATSVRDEVELEPMTAQLLAVVEDTLHPESVSLWMQPATRK
jgi:hypothetical protein